MSRALHLRHLASRPCYECSSILLCARTRKVFTTLHIPAVAFKSTTNSGSPPNPITYFRGKILITRQTDCTPHHVPSVEAVYLWSLTSSSPWVFMTHNRDIFTSRGQAAQASRRLFTGWTARIRSRVSFLCVQTSPGVHSASYKMSTGGFSRGKSGRAWD